MKRALVGALALGFALAGCGSSGGAPTADAGSARTGALLPWKVGNTWTYRVTDSKSVATKVTTIGDVEAVGGTGVNSATMANRIVTSKKDGTDQTVIWAANLGDKIVRYREQSFEVKTGVPSGDEYYDPHKLWVDESAEHTTVGATWLEIHQETKAPVGETSVGPTEKRDAWTVTSESESVTVPAGTFDALVVQKAGSSTKTYWFVHGVGKVKELGEDQLEELTTFMLAP